TQEFRQRSVEHDARLEQDQPFLQGMLGAVKGAAQLRRDKAALASDLQLATQEIDRAAALDSSAVVAVDGTSIAADGLRALLLSLHGQLELVGGTRRQA